MADLPLAFSGTARYALVRKLGSGGMGTVYDVEDKKLGRRCALKVMREAPQGGRLLRFKREFRAVCDLRHPNLVRLFELATEEGAWFYTMELIRGVDLLDAVTGEESVVAETETDPSALTAPPTGRRGAPLRRSPCDFASLDGLMPQLLDALEFLHGEGLVHRDLKPSNVLVDERGCVKLVDFGIVKLLTSPTQTAGLMGTLAYMSPEQCAGGEVTPASDLYALGCMLFQIVTGTLPFDPSSLKIVMDHQLTEAPLASERATGVPERYVDVIAALLSKAPAERPSITEIRQRLGFLDYGATTDERPVDLSDLFVGRSEERQRLSELLEDAAGGAIRAVFIEGDSGVGKTWLASFVAQQAMGEGFGVFRGRCYERELLPFRAFDQLMDELALHVRGLPRERKTALAMIDAVARLFPTFGAGDEGAGPELAPLEQRHVAMQALNALLERLSSDRPLLFIVDDLHWTDAESVALLEHLLNAEARLLVVGLHRPEIDAEGHPLSAFFERRAHGADERVERMRLGPMADHELAMVLLSHSVGGIDRDGAAELSHQIGGSPFVATQVGTLLRKRRRARAEHQGLGHISVTDLVRLRLAELPADTLAAVEILACAGGVLERAVLQRASELGDEALAAALETALDERILRANTASGAELDATSYDFYHDTFRETAYEGLDDAARRALHARLAAALEQLRPDALESLLKHWSAAGDEERAARYLEAAAEDAANKLAFGRAAQLYAQRLSRQDHSARDQLRMLERLGELSELSGRLEQALEARRSALRVAEGVASTTTLPAETLSLTTQRLRRLEVRTLLHLKRYAEGRERLEALLRAHGLTMDRPRWALYARLLWLQLRLTLWRLLPDGFGRRTPSADKREWFDVLELMTSVVVSYWPLDASEYVLRYRLRARRIVGEGGVRPVCLQVFEAALMGCPQPRAQARLLKRLEQLEPSTDKAERDASDILRARGAVLMHQDAAAALEALERSLEVLDRIGWVESYDAVTSHTFAVWAAEAAGDYDAGLRHCDALDQTRATMALAAEPFRARVLIMRGETAEATARVETWAHRLAHEVYTSEQVWLRFTRTLLALARWDPEAAEAALAELETLCKRTGDLLFSLPRTRWMVVSLSTLLMRLSADSLDEAGLRRAGRLARTVARKGWTALRPAGHRGLALLAHHAGRSDAALRHARAALDSVGATAGPWEEWLSRRLLAALSGAPDPVAEELQAWYGFAESGLVMCQLPSSVQVDRQLGHPQL